MVVLPSIVSRLGANRTVIAGLCGLALTVIALGSVDLIAAGLERTEHLNPFEEQRAGGLSILVLLTMAFAGPMGFAYAMVNAPAQTVLHERAPAEIPRDLLLRIDISWAVSIGLVRVDNIRAAGFARLNLDLMYGFAGQSLDSWRATLEHAIALAPEYITLYRMRYKLTRISHQAPDVTLEHVRPMTALAKQLLHAAGYMANPGKTTYSRIPGDVGTSSYLARRVQDGMPYLGLGSSDVADLISFLAGQPARAGKHSH